KVAVWQGQHKLILTCDSGQSVLYNLASDPEESLDVSAEQAKIVDDLKRSLKQQLAKQPREPQLRCPNL
ncbi:MAG TPA: hypothetical protein VHV54_22705, partial [Candidatus Binatia bacterium]|nr:hypothetical protein [Candidatus Binatia bacterium]